MPLSISSFVRPLALGAATIALVVTAGCSGTDEPTANPPAPVDTASSPAAAASPSVTSPSATSSSPATAAESNDAMIAAGRLAEKEIAKGKVSSIESERDGWEVHVVFADGGEQWLKTDPSGSKVIAGPTDERPDADDKAENREFSKADVDFVQAVEATVAEISDGRITDLSLDAENRQLVWEAEVSVGSEQRVVQIDAGSGKVLSNRADD